MSNFSGCSKTSPSSGAPACVISGAPVQFEPWTSIERLGFIGKDGCATARRNGHGVQEWSDGSKYEGEFLNNLKHGTGIFTWANGEFFEGSFYKDYRHGKGIYSWPGGHKFVGKFYLNRKEGYGVQVFPDGSTFQGLYHADERFGPGLVTYPDGRQDVGLWHRERLLRLCTSLEDGFTLRDFPEHNLARSSIRTDPWSPNLHQAHTSNPSAGGLLGCQGPWPGSRGASTDPLLFPYKELLQDERFILPPDIERYSTDSDHLPIPWGLRRELDQMFFGEHSEGPDTDPAAIAALPLQHRMEAHIYKHRLEAEGLDWDVQAILSENREQFGPKGPLELRSERLLQEASLGDPQSVYRSLRDKKVHPDVGDANGHTALIAATVNCHKDVIHLLLDSGADVNKLNSEEMSALAVCTVLYYPIQSLHHTVAEMVTQGTLPTSQVSKWHSVFVTSQNDPMERTSVDRTSETRPLIGPALAKLPVQSHQAQPEDQADQYEDAAGPGSCQGSEVFDETEPSFYSDQDQHDSQEGLDTGIMEEREEGEEKKEGVDVVEKENNGKERTESEMVREGENGEDGEEREMVKLGEEGGIGEEREGAKEAGVEKEEGGEEREMVEEEKEVEERKVGEEGEEREIGEEEEEREDEEEEEHSIQVLDGNIPVGTVSWKEGGKALASRGGQRASVVDYPTFDSARSVASFPIVVSEEVMQQTAEVLSRTSFGPPAGTDPQETVLKMALLKKEHRARWTTLTLLLDRGADPNASRVPMPVLFLAIKAGDVQGVRRLLECGARTDMTLPPEQKGLYPLHIAAALPGPEGPRITELLLHAVADPDVRAQDEHEVFELDKNTVEPQAGFGNKSVPFSGPPPCFYTAPREAPVEGGRTPLHVACQRDSDYIHARDVVSLLLSHKASTHLLWSGHSPLSLAIASGNNLALDELLAGGADPNLPLTRRVGSALCAMTNINYDCGAKPRNRAKLLDKLMRAGANILMPVVVGEGRRLATGTAVDYAHYTFHQDWRIAHTPYHALNPREREAYNARRQMLSLLGDLLRQAAVRMEHQRLDKEQLQGISSVSPTDRFASTGAGATPPQGRTGRLTLPEEQPSTDSLPQLEHRQGMKGESKMQNVRKPLFKYCYQCGRSVGVALVPCSRCHEVFYCSKTCKMRAWNERHKEECVRVSDVDFSDSDLSQEKKGWMEVPSKSRRQSTHIATSSLIEQMKLQVKMKMSKEKQNKAQRAGRITAQGKVKDRPSPIGQTKGRKGRAMGPAAHRRYPGVTAKTKDRHPSLAQKVLETHVDLKENYSFI